MGPSAGRGTGKRGNGGRGGVGRGGAFGGRGGRASAVKRTGPKKQTTKNQLRSLQRIIRKQQEQGNPPSEDMLARVKELEGVVQQKMHSDHERKMVLKYRKVKFFELRKLVRRLSSVQRNIEEESDAGAKEALKERERGLKADMELVVFFPKDQKYVGLFGEDDPKSRARREKAREAAAKLARAAEAEGKDWMAEVIAKFSQRKKEAAPKAVRPQTQGKRQESLASQSRGDGKGPPFKAHTGSADAGSDDQQEEDSESESAGATSADDDHDHEDSRSRGVNVADDAEDDDEDSEEEKEAQAQALSIASTKRPLPPEAAETEDDEQESNDDDGGGGGERTPREDVSSEEEEGDDDDEDEQEEGGLGRDVGVSKDRPRDHNGEDDDDEDHDDNARDDSGTEEDAAEATDVRLGQRKRKGEGEDEDDRGGRYKSTRDLMNDPFFLEEAPEAYEGASSLPAGPINPSEKTKRPRYHHHGDEGRGGGSRGMGSAHRGRSYGSRGFESGGRRFDGAGRAGRGRGGGRGGAFSNDRRSGSGDRGRGRSGRGGFRGHDRGRPFRGGNKGRDGGAFRGRGGRDTGRGGRR